MRVSFLTGDYRFRQMVANSIGVDLYIEYHFNHYSAATNYTLVRVASSSQPLSVEFAQTHAQMINEYLKIPLYKKDDDGVPGVLMCKKSGRDSYNLSLLNMPSVIIEPLFLSNPSHVKIAIGQQGIKLLANILYASLLKVVPENSHIGFSVGHKYQRVSPFDRGSVALHHPEFTEGDIADRVVQHTMCLIEHNIPPILYELPVDYSTTANISVDNEG